MAVGRREKETASENTTTRKEADEGVRRVQTRIAVSQTSASVHVLQDLLQNRDGCECKSLVVINMTGGNYSIA